MVPLPELEERGFRCCAGLPAPAHWRGAQRKLAARRQSPQPPTSSQDAAPGREEVSPSLRQARGLPPDSGSHGHLWRPPILRAASIRMSAHRRPQGQRTQLRTGLLALIAHPERPCPLTRPGKENPTSHHYWVFSAVCDGDRGEIQKCKNTDFSYANHKQKPPTRASHYLDLMAQVHLWTWFTTVERGGCGVLQGLCLPAVGSSASISSSVKLS